MLCLCGGLGLCALGAAPHQYLMSDLESAAEIRNRFLDHFYDFCRVPPALSYNKPIGVFPAWMIEVGSERLPCALSWKLAVLTSLSETSLEGEKSFPDGLSESHSKD